MTTPAEGGIVRRWVGPAVVAVGCVVLSFDLHRVGPAFDRMYHEIDHASPYFAWADPWMQYLVMPLAVLVGVAVVLAPGLGLCLALGAARSLEEWLLKGLGVSLVVLSVATQVIQAVVGMPVTGFGFALTAIVLGVIGSVVWRCRLAGGADLPAPWPARGGWGRLCWLIVPPLVFLIALTPKFFWEAFNGDGAHAFEASRRLLWNAFPFFPADSGEGGMYPGVNTFLFTYPTAWFIRLYGEYECAARLPLLLYLTALYAAIVCVAAEGRPPLGGAERALIWAGVIGFGLVMSYSATYDPYCADIALPATQDTLLMVCFLGAVFAFLRRQWDWAWLFTLLAVLGSPAGLLLAVLWLVAVAAAQRPRPWLALVLWGAGIALAMAFAAAAPDVLAAFGANPPGEEHSAGHLLHKFRFLIPFDFARLAFLVVPCGIYAVFGVIAWRRLDAASRALWLVTGGIFGLYYLLAYVSLHYFAPAMVLPLVAFWRHHRVAAWPHRGLALAGCWAGALVALGLGLPTGTAIYTATRDIGEELEVRDLPSYARAAGGYLRAQTLLMDVFPKDWHPDVPEKAYGGSPLAWNYYAHHRGSDAPRANYVLTGPAAPAPEGATLIASNDDGTVWVRDRELWERQQHMHPATSNGRALYAFSRDILFRRAAASEHYCIIDLGEWRDRLFGK